MIGRLEGILDWYKENTESNPNMHELVEVLSQASREEEKDTELMKQLTRLEIERLITNGIVSSEDDSLVKMVLEIYEQALKGPEISEEKEDYAKMLAGIVFFLKTQEVNGQKATYNNEFEYSKLMRNRSNLVDNGEKISDNFRANEDFIIMRHGKDINLDRDLLVARVDSTLPIEEKIEAAADLIRPYVYPERLEMFKETCKRNKTVPLNVTLAAIRGLSMGIDFETVSKMLDNANLSGFGWGLELGTVTLNAKNGPEFYFYTMEKNQMEIPQESLEFINRIKEENAEYEKNASAKKLEGQQK